MSNQEHYKDGFHRDLFYKRIPVQKDIYNESPILIDVRSPLEFEKAHIPGAYNIPLFSNQERAEIGTLYKVKGKQAAIIQGLHFAGKKLQDYAHEAFKLSKGESVLCYCWRGGMRSASMGWLFNTAGINTTILEGGYKAYRNFVLSDFEKFNLKIIVLGGKTGIGKTNLLTKLKHLGEPVLDLEGIANHKGSAFGWIGEEPQCSNEQFENNLNKEMSFIEARNKYVWVENESRSIGSNFIPEAIWNQMKSSVLIDIERSLEQRVEILVDSYHTHNAEDLILSFRKIEKRLGHEATSKAIGHILDHDLKKAAAIALAYYDKCYTYNLEQNRSPHIIQSKCGDLSDEEIIEQLLQQKNKIIDGK